MDVLDAAVLIICIMSLLLCLRALYNAEILKRSVVDFFRTQFGIPLTMDERLEFLNLWYAMIVVSFPRSLDVLIEMKKKIPKIFENSEP